MSKKNITLGVTGSIAAYKAADLVSKLTKQGYNVTVIMTANALKMVGAPTFFALSRNTVISDLFELPEWTPGHVALAERTDLFVIAPATANILAKMAHGIADDALSTAYLANKAPVLVAPAMNNNMYSNIATAENIRLLSERGVIIVGPDTGSLACGTSGTGRMAEPAEILNIIETRLKQ